MRSERVRAGAAVLVSLGLGLFALVAGPAAAADWGGIEPGATTVEQVRARFGAPSRETRAKEEGYETTEWIYEGARAPGGLQKMTVDYGLLTPQGYKPTVVRVLRLEPKPKIFGRNTVIQAWGVPDGISQQNGQDRFFYQTGLVVIFDKQGEEAQLLDFTPPQPAAAPARSAPPAPAAPKRK
jgi:hypothetical protein